MFFLNEPVVEKAISIVDIVKKRESTIRRLQIDMIKVVLQFGQNTRDLRIGLMLLLHHRKDLEHKRLFLDAELLQILANVSQHRQSRRGTRVLILHSNALSTHSHAQIAVALFKVQCPTARFFQLHIELVAQFLKLFYTRLFRVDSRLILTRSQCLRFFCGEFLRRLPLQLSSSKDVVSSVAAAQQIAAVVQSQQFVHSVVVRLRKVINI